MFDPRDLATDPRTRPAAPPRRDLTKEREQRQRSGHRREYDPRSEHQNFQERMDRAVADIGVYRAERVAREQGLDKEQKAWSGLVKPNELQHDVAVFRAAKDELARLFERGAVLKRIRIDAELKGEIARRTERARARGGKAAADAARFEAAAELGLPIKDGRVQVPDAQLEYSDIEGRSGRVNVEIATEHYRAKSIAAKAAAGFAVHGSNGRATARVARSLGQDHSGGGGGGGRDKASIEL